MERTATQGPPISFHPGDLDDDLAQRATGGLPPNLIAKRDLGRYYKLLRQSLPTFSEAEASLIVDALDNFTAEPHTARLLRAAVEDAIASNKLAEKWSVDDSALVKRLRALAPFEAMAVADACERARKRTGSGENLPSALRAVGLAR